MTRRTVKICAHCGRSIAPRRMSDHDWEQLGFCSAGCRREAGAAKHRALEQSILALLSARAPGSSICPSEAARAVCGDAFRSAMEDTRRAARRLAHRGVVAITQRGRAVDPASIHGPIRLTRGPRWDGPGDSA